MTPSSQNVDVSILLPVFNENGHIVTEIERIRSAMESSPFSYEVIVVDDGSTDGSTAELGKIAGIRLIRLGENRGSGSARRIGTQEANGRVVVWTDADMSYPNEDIPQLVKELEGYDQVVGARLSEQGSHKLLRAPAKWLIRKLASYLMRRPIPDLNSGFRAFRRDVGAQFLHHLPKGFSCVTTLTMSFMSHGYSIKYVPIEYRARAGSSKFHWWTDTKQYLIQVIRMVLSYEPLRVFMPAGAVMLAAGLAKLGYDWTTRDFRLATNTLLLLFASFQVFAIGLLADLVVRVTKPRELIPPASL